VTPPPFPVARNALNELLNYLRGVQRLSIPKTTSLSSDGPWTRAPSPAPRLCRETMLPLRVGERRSGEVGLRQLTPAPMARRTARLQRIRRSPSPAPGRSPITPLLIHAATPVAAVVTLPFCPHLHPLSQNHPEAHHDLQHPSPSRRSNLSFSHHSRPQTFSNPIPIPAATSPLPRLCPTTQPTTVTHIVSGCGRLGPKGHAPLCEAKWLRAVFPDFQPQLRP
jgi:hypothetical protein